MKTQGVLQWKFTWFGVALVVCAAAPPFILAANRVVLCEEFTNPG